MKRLTYLLAILLISFSGCEYTLTEESNESDNLPDITGFPIVGTNQITSFDNSTSMLLPGKGDDFYGQNSNYLGNEPYYVDNGDGTVTDMISGLMWQKSFDHNRDGTIDYDDKLTYDEILTTTDTVSTAGYDDWRVPNIMEQYSLIMFSGQDISGYEGTSTDGLVPFINTEYFDYAYGDTDAGERLVDVQCATTTEYVSLEVDRTVFGVNFANGRIKGYETQTMGQDNAFNYLMVRGNLSYGVTDFIENGDGTITDHATELMWMQEDNGAGVMWEDALSYAESFEYAGYKNWRLPDAKELQSIVDYNISPATTGNAAINPIFSCTQITNEAGEDDFPWYWSSTTHETWMEGSEGIWGAYVAFGRCMANISEMYNEPGGEIPFLATASISDEEISWIDIYGAGAQRSDPKTDNLSEYSEENGPQSDAIRIYNHVRLVRSL